MRKYVFILSVIIFFVAGGPGRAEGAKLSDPANVVETESGKIFTITLESNRTTGYQWEIAPHLDKLAVEVVGVEYVKSGAAIPGESGVENWTFRALSSRREDVLITFQYIRPWEKDVPPGKKVTFRVMIKKGDDERQLDRIQRDMDKVHAESWDPTAGQ